MTDNYIVGTCDSMCPTSEVEMRRKNKLVHFYESKYLVKEFSRSAADKKRPLPCDIRTFDALQKSLDYLINKILLDREKPFSIRYDFIFDRCRAIRQEVVMQNLPFDETLKLFEPIVMFLAFSLYRLNGSLISVFDSKICLQHLQECLLKCLTCYDEAERLEPQSVLKNRETIEAVFLMVNMNEPSALMRSIRLNTKLKSSFVMKKSIELCLNIHLRNFYKTLRCIQELPHVICAVASLKLPFLRKEILHSFSVAYNSKTLSVPVDFIQKILLYDEVDFIIRDLTELGIYDGDGEKPTKVIFSRTKFDKSKSISDTLQHFVEEKLCDYHLPDLILFDVQ